MDEAQIPVPFPLPSHALIEDATARDPLQASRSTTRKSLCPSITADQNAAQSGAHGHTHPEKTVANLIIKSFSQYCNIIFTI